MRMRKVSIGAAVVALAMIVVAFAGKPWFDMENCDYCSNLIAEKGLMENMPKWEHHNVKNGSMTITVVNEEYIPAYKRAMAKMEEVGKREQAGEKVNTCGMCDAYSALFMKGVQWDVVESGNTFISLMWSDNPEIVDEIHAMTDRTNKEMAMMEEMEKAGEMKKAKMHDKHKDHDHK